jgi:hypothetical protein
MIMAELAEARIKQAAEFHPRLGEVWDAIKWRLHKIPSAA